MATLRDAFDLSGKVIVATGGGVLVGAMAMQRCLPALPCDSFCR